MVVISRTVWQCVVNGEQHKHQDNL